MTELYLEEVYIGTLRQVSVTERVCQPVIPALILSASAQCFVTATLCGLDMQRKSTALEGHLSGQASHSLGDFSLPFTSREASYLLLSLLPHCR